MVASLTIAVPSYERRDRLARLLASVAASLDPLPSVAVDVVVVLDGSTDGSAEMVAELATRFPVPLNAHWQPNAGLAAARNAAIDRATGEFVWLLDDDMEIARPALDRHLTHDRSGGRILMGPANVASTDPVILEIVWWYEDRHQRLAAAGRVDAAQDCSFANTSAPTALLRAWRFDDRFRGYGIEDYELAVRLLSAGEVIAFASDAGVVHDYRPSRAEHLLKLREEGVNRVRFTRLHPEHAAVVFKPWPGRVEHALRIASRWPVGARPLWWAARMVDAVGMRLGPQRRRRVLVMADLAAVYAGVARAGRDPKL